MRTFKYAVALYFSISFGFSQVCCSLVGSVNSNSNVSNWESQWPSQLDFNRRANWIIGSTLGKSDNGDLNIQYGFNGTVFTEYSNYIFSNTVGYISGLLNVSNISEKISFEQTETNVNHLNLNIGFRHFLSHKIGYASGAVNIPITTKYSNDKFLFKTNAVSSVSASWIKTFLISNSIINQRFSLQLSGSKNLKIDPEVYVDDNFNLNLSTSFSFLNQFSISPNINTNYYKLLAPISPFESERQSRWLGVFTAGFDITPVSEKIDWLHFSGSIPLFSWASEIGFPDGAQPIPSISLSIVKKIIN
ncbi:MAG: hypothetical protein V3R52_00375 [Candidatus Neomarinimicrobiota bacterium]